MPTAFVMVNCDLEIESEQKAINKLKNMPGVIDVNEVTGVYDIVVKITSDTLERYTNNRRSQINYDINSDRIEIGIDKITKLAFGYKKDESVS